LTDVAELIASVSLPQNPPGEANGGGIEGVSSIKTADFQYLGSFEEDKSQVLVSEALNEHLSG
jgi:hypothetical protein